MRSSMIPGCIVTMLITACSPPQKPARALTPEPLIEAHALDSPDQGGSVSPGSRDQGRAYAQDRIFDTFVFHDVGEVVTDCETQLFGCFDDRPYHGGLKLFAYIGELYLERLDVSPIRAELEELIKGSYYIGLDLPHSDGKRHMFACSSRHARAPHMDYHTEDVYVRCMREGFLSYTYNAYPEEYAGEERRVRNGCGGREFDGPPIRDPWFSYFKRARELHDAPERPTLTYHVLVHSPDLESSYKIGPMHVQYRFDYRQGTCMHTDALAIAPPTEPPLDAVRLKLE